MEELARETIGEYEAVVEYEQDDCPKTQGDGYAFREAACLLQRKRVPQKSGRVVRNIKNTRPSSGWSPGKIYCHKNIPWIGLENTATR
jgi:hypothetical protein